LLICPLSSNRTRAASLGGTSRTRAPEAISCCASSCPSPRAPSIAHLLLGQPLAHSSNPSTYLLDARTRNRPSCFSCTSSATAVCDPLCRSIPITTPATVHHLHAKISRQEEPRWARLNSEPEHASLQPHRGPDTTSRHLVRKPDQQVGRRFVSQPVAPHERYDRSRTPLTKFHSDGSCANRRAVAFGWVRRAD
jgi:hypothetical protein